MLGLGRPLLYSSTVYHPSIIAYWNGHLGHSASYNYLIAYDTGTPRGRRGRMLREE